MNTVNLVGNWVRDCEISYSQAGKAIMKNTLAVSRPYDKEKSDFIRVVAFSKTGELAGNYTSKGSKVGIVGRIQTGSYKKDDGTTVYTTDVIADQIIFLDSKKDNQQRQEQKPEPRYNADPGDPFKGDSTEIDSDSLPF